MTPHINLQLYTGKMDTVTEVAGKGLEVGWSLSA